MAVSSSFLPANSALVSLSISVWTARARLSKEDIDPSVLAQMPPDALASLGSKRLVNPELLRPINSLKSEAFRLLTTAGTHFLSGFLLSDEAIQRVTPELDRIGGEWTRAVNAFCRDYDSAVRDWASQFPQWQRIIYAAVPDVDELRQRRFRYGYQVYRIEPVRDLGGGPADTLYAEAEGLPDTAICEMADAIRSYVDSTFGRDRERYNDRTLNGLEALAQKASDSAFLAPRLQGLSEFLRATAAAFNGRGSDPAAVSALTTLMRAVSDPQECDRICTEWQARAQSGDHNYFRELITGTPAGVPVIPTQPAPAPADPQPAPAPADPQPATAPTLDIDSMLRGAMEVLNAPAPASDPQPAPTAPADPQPVPSADPAPAPAPSAPKAAALLQNWGLF